MNSKGEGRELGEQAAAIGGQDASNPRLRLRLTGEADAASSNLQPAQELLEGAPAIAAFMGWKKVRRVYHIRTLGAPIRKRTGLGIYALRSELVGWLTSHETLEVHQQHGSPGGNGAGPHP